MESLLNKYLSDLKIMISSSSSELIQMSNICELIAFEYYLSNNYLECRGFLEKCLQLRNEYLKNDEINESLMDTTFRIVFVLRKELESFPSEKIMHQYNKLYEKTLSMRRKFDSPKNNGKFKTKANFTSDEINKLNDLYLMDSTMIYCLEAEKKIAEQDYNEAENFYKVCLKLRGDKYGPESVGMSLVLYPYAEMLTKIGFQYNDIKVITEAIELFEKCININISEHGKFHKSVHSCLIRLVSIYREKWENFGSENDLLSSRALAMQLLSVQENLYGLNSSHRTETLSLINNINQEIDNLSGTFLFRNKADYRSIDNNNDATSIAIMVLKYLIKKYEKLKNVPKTSFENELTTFLQLSVNFGSESTSTQNKLMEISNNIFYWSYSNIFSFNDISELDILNKLLSSANEYGSNYLSSVISFEINRILATFYFVQGNYAMAIKQLNAAVSNCPQSPGGYFISGMADALLFLTESYSKIERHDDALHSARLATDIAQRRVESYQKLLKSNGDLFNIKEIGLSLDCYTSVFLTYCSLAQELEKNKMYKLSSEWNQRALENANYFEIDSTLKSTIIQMINKSKYSKSDYSNERGEKVSQEYFSYNQNQRKDSISSSHTNRARPQSAMPRLMKYNLPSDNSSVDIIDKDYYDYKRSSIQLYEEGDEGLSQSQYGMNDFKVRPKSAISKLGGGYSSPPAKRNPSQYQNYVIDNTNQDYESKQFSTSSPFYQPKENKNNFETDFVKIEEKKEEIIYKQIEKMRQARNVIFNVNMGNDPSKKTDLKNSLGKMKKKDLMDFDNFNKSPYESSNVSFINSGNNNTFLRKDVNHTYNFNIEDNNNFDPINNYIPPPQSYKYLRTVAAKSTPLIFQSTSNIKVSNNIDLIKKQNPKVASSNVIEIDEFFDPKGNQSNKNHFPFIEGMKVEARRSYKILGVRSKWYTGRIVSGVFSKGLYDIHFDNGDKESGVHVDNIRVYDYKKNTSTSSKTSTIPRNKNSSINLNLSKFNNSTKVREEIVKDMQNVVMRVLSGVNGREVKRKAERLRVKNLYVIKIQALIRGALLRSNFFHIRNILEREKILRRKETDLIRKEAFLSQSYNNFVQNVNQFERFVQQKQYETLPNPKNIEEPKPEAYNGRQGIDKISTKLGQINKTLDAEPSISIDSVDTLPKHIKSREIIKLKNDIQTMQLEQRRLVQLEDERFKNIQVKYNQLFNELIDSKNELQRMRIMEEERRKSLKEASFHSTEHILDNVLKQNSLGSNSIFNEHGKVKIDDFWLNNDSRTEKGSEKGFPNEELNFPLDIKSNYKENPLEFYDRVENLEISFLNKSTFDNSIESPNKLFRLSEIDNDENIEENENIDELAEDILIKNLASEALGDLDIVGDQGDDKDNWKKFHLCISKIDMFNLQFVEEFERNDIYLILYFDDHESIKTDTFINCGSRAFWDFDNSYIRFPTSFDYLKSENVKIAVFHENKISQIGFGEMSLPMDVLRNINTQITVNLYNADNSVVGHVQITLCLLIEEDNNNNNNDDDDDDDDVVTRSDEVDIETEKYMSSSNLLSLLPNKESHNNNNVYSNTIVSNINSEILSNSVIVKHLLEMKLMYKIFPMPFYLDDVEDSMLHSVIEKRAKEGKVCMGLTISCNQGHKLILKVKDTLIPHLEVEETQTTKDFIYFFPNDTISDGYITIIKQEVIKYLHPKERILMEEINESTIIDQNVILNSFSVSNSWKDYLSAEFHSSHPNIICKGRSSILHWEYLLILLKTLWRNYSEWACKTLILHNDLYELVGSMILEVSLIWYHSPNDYVLLYEKTDSSEKLWHKKFISTIQSLREPFVDIINSIKKIESDISNHISNWHLNFIDGSNDDKNFEHHISSQYKLSSGSLYKSLEDISNLDNDITSEENVISLNQIGEEINNNISNITERALKYIKIPLDELDKEKNVSSYSHLQFLQIRKNLQLYEWKRFRAAKLIYNRVIGELLIKELTEQVSEVFDWSSISDSINGSDNINEKVNKIYLGIEQAAKKINLEDLKSLIQISSRKK